MCLSMAISVSMVFPVSRGALGASCWKDQPTSATTIYSDDVLVHCFRLKPSL